MPSLPESPSTTEHPDRKEEIRKEGREFRSTMCCCLVDATIQADVHNIQRPTEPKVRTHHGFAGFHAPSHNHGLDKVQERAGRGTRPDLLNGYHLWASISKTGSGLRHHYRLVSGIPDYGVPGGPCLGNSPGVGGPILLAAPGKDISYKRFSVHQHNPKQLLLPCLSCKKTQLLGLHQRSSSCTQIQ